MAEQGVEPVEHLVGDGVLQLLGLGVDAGPVHLQHVDEEGLDEPVLADDAQRHAPAVGRQAHAMPRLVLDEAAVGQRLDHGGDGAGHHGERVASSPMGTRPSRPSDSSRTCLR